MDTKKLRQKILDLAIHGKLVPQDPNDEPASILLERIRAEKERLIAEGKIKRSKKSATSDTSHYENVPFEVPDGWCWCRLEDYFVLLSGQDFPPEKYNDAQNGIPYIIGASNLYMGKIVINRWTQAPSVKTAKGDLLVVCKGAGVGKMALNDIGDMHIARQIQAIRDVSKMMSIEYIKMVVSYYIEDIIADANGLIPGLKRELLLSLLMPIPPLQEQRRIITTFQKLMFFIESIDNDSLELTKSIKIAQSKILDLAIHGRLVPQDAHDEPASELLKRINPKAVASCDNPHYADIPESWVECKLGDVCSFESGYAYSSELYKSMGIPLIRISNIVDGYVNIENCVYIKGDELSKNVRVKQGDLLIAMSGATTGKIGIYTYSDDAILNQRVGNITVKEHSILSMGYRDLFINAIKVEIEKKAYGGAQPNISGKMICNFSFSLPPYNEQLRIVSKVNELFSQLDMIEKSLQA